MINDYTPTSSAEGEKMEQFYDDIEREMADSDSKNKIITGDVIAEKIGTKTKEEHFKSMGAFGIGKRNERGDRLIEFAEEHKLTQLWCDRQTSERCHCFCVFLTFLCCLLRLILLSVLVERPWHRCVVFEA